ncbi:MAG: phosphatase PAP2 family protein [Ferruginibacter sp.]
MAQKTPVNSINTDTTFSPSHKYSVRPYVLPAVFISYGFIAKGHNYFRDVDENTKSEITEDHPLFKTGIENYLQYSPAAAVYILNAVGIKGEHNFRDRTIIYALSTAISAVAVTGLKLSTKIIRPDGSADNSFPSGHTATAFAAAAFLQKEYKNVSPWYGIAGYAAATFTGILRIYNNKHWVSDVVAGAGVGILSTKVAYCLYPFIKRKIFKDKNSNIVIAPFYQPHNAGLAMVYRFSEK